MEARIEKTLGALRENGMAADFYETKEEVVSAVKEILFEGATITAGGSVSLKESGVWDLICSPEYRFYDRAKPGISEEERQEAFRQAIGCDFFFCSSNAVTENGELINVDGAANRVSSICFGPKKVIMVVGVNKIVKDIDEGFLRIKKIAAPKNTVRLGLNTPCAKTGQCVSLMKSDAPCMTDGCQSPQRICRQYLVSAKQKTGGRIHILLCAETLGY